MRSRDVVRRIFNFLNDGSDRTFRHFRVPVQPAEREKDAE